MCVCVCVRAAHMWDSCYTSAIGWYTDQSNWYHLWYVRHRKTNKHSSNVWCKIALVTLADWIRISNYCNSVVLCSKRAWQMMICKIGKGDVDWDGQLCWQEREWIRAMDRERERNWSLASPFTSIVMRIPISLWINQRIGWATGLDSEWLAWYKQVTWTYWLNDLTFKYENLTTSLVAQQYYQKG